MATAKFFHDTRRVKNPSLPAAIRITIRHNATSAQIPTDVKVTPAQWDGTIVKDHPQEKAPNIILKKKMSDVENAMLFLLNDPGATFKDANELRDAIVQRAFPSKIKAPQKPKNLFVPFYQQFMESRKSPGTRVIYDRAVFNHAVNEDIITTSPFKGFDLKQEPTLKRSMDLETLRRIRDTEVAPWQEEYRDMFMLMFYLIGINAADLFQAKKEQLVNGRLEYTRQKTGEKYSVKVQPEAMAIIEKYKGQDYLLSPMDRHKDYKDYLRHMNRALSTLGQVYTTSSEKKGEVIFPKLSSYWSRHTWATLAYEIGIPVDVIGQALGHSDRQHVITFVYIRLDNKKVDEANRQVLDYVAA